MRTNIKSEIYKFIHSPLLLLHIIVPAIGSLIFVGYFAISNWNEWDKVTAFIQSLTVTFPVIIGIIMAMTCEFEQNAGNFQAMLTTKNAKFVPHISKMIVVLTFGFMATIFTMILFYIGFYFTGHISFSLLFFVQTAILMFVSIIPLYLLSYLVSFLYGKGMSISLGIIGGLLSALLLTGLGDYNWWYTPWGVASRFSLSFSLIDLGVSVNGINRAIASLLLFAIILTALFILIFSKWESEKKQD